MDEPPGPGEFGAIARWVDSLPLEGARVAVGPGDDVAWLDAGAPLALSTDTLVEGVHFRRSWCSSEQLGRRRMGAALSDLAASRARPVGFLLALSVRSLDGWIDGVIDECEAQGAGTLH